VVVDGNTLFVTFIMSGESLPDVGCFPRPIMDWSQTFYRQVCNNIDHRLPHQLQIQAFAKHIPNFSLRENDYVAGNRKFGGNAQSISGRRWVHHTSFLWNFDTANMELLQIPEKQPDYRANREHGDFLSPLSEFWPSVTSLVDCITDQLSQEFSVEHVAFEDAMHLVKDEPHRKANKWVNIEAEG